MKNVTNVLKPVSAWYKLGVQLGVPKHELKQFEGNYPKDGDRCKGEVLTYWFNNAEEQSWDVLADAVENAGHRSLANEIRGVTPEGMCSACMYTILPRDVVEFTEASCLISLELTLMHPSVFMYYCDSNCSIQKWKKSVWGGGRGPGGE